MVYFKIDGLPACYTGLVNADEKAFGWGSAKNFFGSTYTGTFKDNMLHGIGK